MIQIFNYNGSNITMKKDNGAVYVNLTEIAKAFPEKNLSKIVNSQEINEYVGELSAITNGIPADLLKVKNGGNDFGTWAHQKVALRVCQKLSTRFAIWVDTKMEELLTSGVATAADDDVTIARAMDVLQKRLQANQQRVQILEGEKEMLTEENKILAPKAEYTDSVLQSRTTYTSTQIAKEVGLKTAEDLHKKLHEMGVIFKQSGQWLLYSKYCMKGYTASRTHQITDTSNGISRTNTYTVWTEKGRWFLHELLKVE